MESLSYESHVTMSEEVREEILFWRENIRHLNGARFSSSLSIDAETRLVVVSDSSQSRAFGFQFQDKYQVLVRRGFTKEERSASSTFRELLALKFIYTESTAEQFAGKRILHLTDNQAVESIMLTGSKKQHIQKVALDIFSACRSLKIDLRVEWRPRDHFLPVHADLGSKSFDQIVDGFQLILNATGELPGSGDS